MKNIYKLELSAGSISIIGLVLKILKLNLGTPVLMVGAGLLLVVFLYVLWLNIKIWATSVSLSFLNVSYVLYILFLHAAMGYQLIFDSSVQIIKYSYIGLIIVVILTINNFLIKGNRSIALFWALSRRNIIRMAVLLLVNLYFLIA